MRRSLLTLALLMLSLPLSASAVLAVWPADGRGLCLAAGDQQWPQAAPDGTGGAIVVWTDYRSGLDGDVYARRVLGDGDLAPGWPNDGLALATGPTGQERPLLLSDGAGGVFIVWQERSSGDYRIILQRVTGAGTIAAGWPEGGMAVRAGLSGSALPQIVSDQAGGVFVAWKDYRDISKSDIYAQRVNADGTIPSPWPVNGAPVTRAVGEQTWPELAPDGSGGLLVAWTDRRTETDFDLGDVYAQRLTASGSVAPGWPLDGAPVCTVAGSQRQPCLVSDLAGGAVIVWEDRRPGTSFENADIYTQRITASGALDPAWPPDGVPVCTASRGQHSPRAVSDGVGGAIIAWKDSRTYYQNGRLNAIHASRITGSGALGPGWIVDGLPVCTSGEPSATWPDPALAADGTGGAFFAWTDGRDHRATERDIYAQHLTATGEPAPGWDPGGALVTRASGDQWCGGIGSDGAGGAIVTWYDGRNVTWSSDGPHGDEDIYCHRLTAAGLSVPPVFALLAAVPNPMREASAITFDLSALERLHVEVYDVTGKRIRTLAAGELFSPGRQTLSWDARDDDSRAVGAGLYFVRISTGAQVAGVKLVRLR